MDPGALAEDGGPRGRVLIELPRAWLDEPCAIDLTVPSRLVCARCDGGGCDGCGRSGALRAPLDMAARTVHVELPRAARGVALRIVEPFGPLGGIAQLIVEVREGGAPSPGVIRREKALVKPRVAAAWPGMALVALAMAAAILIAAFAR